MTRSCSAAGSGFNIVNQALPANGRGIYTASAAWLNYPSTCTWTATGPGGTSSVQETMITVASHIDDAVFVGQSVPATMAPGAGYQVFVTMRNNGTRNWEVADAIELGSLAPENNMTWGRNRVPLDASVGLGQNKQFSFTVTAPAQPGSYHFQWSLLKGGQRFSSASTDTVVTVQAPPPVPVGAPVLNISRTPRPMTADASYTVQWNSSGATNVSYSCSDMPGMSFGPSGQYSGTASRTWVNAPATCTWTASGPGGNTQVVEVLTTGMPSPYCH